MPEILPNNGVRSWCEYCAALTVYNPCCNSWVFSKETEASTNLTKTRVWTPMKCTGCERGGLALIESYMGGRAQDELKPRILDWTPSNPYRLDLPAATEPNILKEFREAERCASIAAYRGACALLRSALEKSLKHFGLGRSGQNLSQRIERAVSLGAITRALGQRAHEEIRILGNDVVHDEWREISEGEWTVAHKYCQRVLEALFDDPVLTGTVVQTQDNP